MKVTGFLSSLLAFGLVSSTAAHMYLKTPQTLNHDALYYDAPLKKDGSDFPCKGYLSYLTKETVQATWKAGSNQTFTLGGTGPHYGGSCQVSLSYDQGQTWRVMKSFEGSCPHRVVGDDQTFNFPVPAEAPSGEALFAWSWFNREQEMYHNCALVEITDGGSGIDDLPNMLVADIGGKCTTPRTTEEVKYPDPGSVIELGDGEYPLAFPSPLADC
ncbi:hypothetical protein RUND412_004912 [Rhizina undulata]